MGQITVANVLISTFERFYLLNTKHRIIGFKGCQDTNIN